MEEKTLQRPEHGHRGARMPRPYITAQFVERMVDGVVKYNITITDATNGVDVDLRLCVDPDGEPFECENMATREHTEKRIAVVHRPVHIEFLPPMMVDVNINN